MKRTLIRSITATALAVASLAAYAGPSVKPPPVAVTVINPVLPVEVRNADPIPVTVVATAESDARIPFNEITTLDLNEPQTVESDVIYTVPEGKQLVVTYASAIIQLPAGQKASFRISGGNSLEYTAIHYLIAVLGGSVVGGGPDAWVGSGPISFILSAGQRLECGVIRSDSTGNAGVGRCSVSGYLVNVP